MFLLDALGGFADTLFWLAALALQTWFVAHAARRVLGVRVGWLRSFLVSLVTILALTQFADWSVTEGILSADANAAATLAVLGVVVLWAFALAAAVLVGLEVLWPTGSLPPLRTLVFGWGRRWRRGRRYAAVSAIAAHHGLGSQLRGLRADDRPTETARALRLALQEAGVTFVKLGQMLSTRADLLPPVYVAELSKLTNRVPPQPWSTVAGTLESELGRAASEVFASVTEEPLASASVAQVHRATLVDGRDVVVKVQRSGAEEQVTQDLDILRRFARSLHRNAPWARAIGLLDLVEGFAASLDEELDYGVELANMAALRASLGARDVRLPWVADELCSRRVIVMERFDGVPVAQASAALATMDADVRAASARRLLTAVLGQVLVDGVFHADLHAGNVVVWPSGAVGLLDLGSVGRLDSVSRRTLGLLLWAIDADDPALATDCLLELLDRPASLDERTLQRDVGVLVTQSRTGADSVKVFAELFALVVRHGFRVPPAIAAALRSLGALEGTLRLMDPRLDLVDAARAVGSEVIGDPSVASVRTELERRLVRLVPLLEHLPRRIDRITQDLEEGRFQVQVRGIAHPDDRAFVTTLVQQVVMAVLAGASVLGGILLLTHGGGIPLVGGVTGFALLGYLLGFAGFVLALRAVALIFGRAER